MLAAEAMRGQFHNDRTSLWVMNVNKDTTAPGLIQQLCFAHLIAKLTSLQKHNGQIQNKIIDEDVIVQMNQIDALKPL